MRGFHAVAFGLALTLSPLTNHAFAQTPSARAQAAFQNWVDGLQGAGTKVTFGKAGLDSAGNALSVDDFAIDFGMKSNGESGRLAAAKLTLNAFSSDGGSIKFTSATIENLKIGQANQKPAIEISKLQFGPSSIPTFKGYISDPARPLSTQVDFLKRFSKANVESAMAQDIKIGGAATIQQASLGSIANGTVRSVNLASFQTKWEPAAQEPEGSLQIASLSLENVDFGAYARLFDPSAYLEAGSTRPAYSFIEKSSFKDFKLAVGGLSLNAREGATGALKVRQFDQDLTSLFDAAMASQGYLGEHPEAAETIANALRASISLDEASVASAEGAGLGAGTFDTITAKSAVLANLTASHFDSLTIEGLNAKGADRSMSARSVALSKVDLATLKDAGGSPQAAPRTVPTVGAVKVADFTTTGGGRTFAVKAIDIAMSYFVGVMPTRIKGTVRNFQFAANEITEPGLRQTLQDLGYETIDLSFDVSAAWQDATSAIAVDTLKLSGVDMGTLAASGSLTGVSGKSMSDPGTILPAELLAGGLQNFRLSFENSGLFDRAIDHAAKVNGKSADELRRAIASNMPAIMAPISDASTRNKFVFAGVSFVNNPQSVDLVSTTPDAVAIHDILGALNTPLVLPVVLKLDASANERN